MKRFFGFTAFFLILTGGSLGAELRFWAPDTLKTGTLDKIIIWDDGVIPPAKVKITDGKGEELFAGQSFSYPVFVSDPGKPPLSVAVCFLAVDPLTKPGSVNLSVSVGGQVLAQKALVIEAKKYNEEVIPLNETMSDLRSKPDLRKDREAEEIWAIYNSFHPDGIFAQSAFIYPLPTPFPQSAYFADMRRYVYSSGKSSVDYHRGADFACPKGTVVLASARGRVALASNRELTGNSVVLEHYPGVYSVYFHMKILSVKAGDVVEKGSQIGLSGMTGLATGPHLHWEFRCFGIPFDGKDLWSADPLDKASITAIITAIERKRG